MRLTLNHGHIELDTDHSMWLGRVGDRSLMIAPLSRTPLNMETLEKAMDAKENTLRNIVFAKYAECIEGRIFGLGFMMEWKTRAPRITGGNTLH